MKKFNEVLLDFSKSLGDRFDRFDPVKLDHLTIKLKHQQKSIEIINDDIQDIKSKTSIQKTRIMDIDAAIQKQSSIIAHHKVEMKTEINNIIEQQRVLNEIQTNSVTDMFVANNKIIDNKFNIFNQHY